MSLNDEHSVKTTTLIPLTHSKMIKRQVNIIKHWVIVQMSPTVWLIFNSFLIQIAYIQSTNGSANKCLNSSKSLLSCIQQMFQLIPSLSFLCDFLFFYLPCTHIYLPVRHFGFCLSLCVCFYVTVSLYGHFSLWTFIYTLLSLCLLPKPCLSLSLSLSLTHTHTHTHTHTGKSLGEPWTHLWLKVYEELGPCLNCWCTFTEAPSAFLR